MHADDGTPRIKEASSRAFFLRPKRSREPHLSRARAQAGKSLIEQTPAGGSLRGIVSFPRQHPGIRAVIVGLMLVAWFIATNHCALGLMRESPVAAAEHANCCNGKQDPANDEQAPGGTVECCKAIHAMTPPDGKVMLRYDAAFFVIHAFAFSTAPGEEAAPPERSAAFREHGPPFAASFSELVLHRSLRAHAPPLTA